MKSSIVFLFLFYVNCSFIFSQNNDSIAKKRLHEISFNVGAIYTPILSNSFYGMNMNMKYYVKKRLSTGFEISCAGKNISDTFSYSIQKPVLDFFEFAWVNQIDLIQSEKIRIGVGIDNGIAIARLGDDTKRETYYTEYGVSEISKKVKANYLYLLEPGINISVRLFTIKNFSDLYLTSIAKYRFTFGNCKYGKLSDFTGCYIGFGVSLIGFN